MKDCYWTTGKVIKINHAKLGKGGLFQTKAGEKYAAGCCTHFPQDAEINKKYKLFISFNRICDVKKI